MKLRKLKRLRQEWAGQNEFQGHSQCCQKRRTCCWMVVGWREWPKHAWPKPTPRNKWGL